MWVSQKYNKKTSRNFTKNNTCRLYIFDVYLLFCMCMLGFFINQRLYARKKKAAVKLHRIHKKYKKSWILDVNKVYLFKQKQNPILIRVYWKVFWSDTFSTKKRECCGSSVRLFGDLIERIIKMHAQSYIPFS